MLAKKMIALALIVAAGSAAAGCKEGYEQEFAQNAASKGLAVVETKSADLIPEFSRALDAAMGSAIGAGANNDLATKLYVSRQLPSTVATIGLRKSSCYVMVVNAAMLAPAPKGKTPEENAARKLFVHELIHVIDDPAKVAGRNGYVSGGADWKDGGVAYTALSGAQAADDAFESKAIFGEHYKGYKPSEALAYAVSSWAEMNQEQRDKARSKWPGLVSAIEEAERMLLGS